MSALTLGGFGGLRSIPTNPIEDPAERMKAAQKGQSKAGPNVQDRLKKELEHTKKFPLATVFSLFTTTKPFK